MKIITDRNKIDTQKWSSFVNYHPNGSIFQTPEMFNVYRETPYYKPIIVVCQDNESNINGILLGVIQKEYKGIIGFLSARSLIIGGPLVINNDLRILNLLLSEYDNLTKRKVIYSQYRNLFDQSNSKEIFKKNKLIYEDHLNVHQDLSASEEMLFEKFSKSRKKGIKKAQRENFVFEINANIEFIEEFYELLTYSYTKIKLPIPSKIHFYKIFEHFKPENYKIFSLRHNCDKIIVMFSLIFNNTLYGYYIGTKNDTALLSLKPNDLFFWELFRWAINNDIRVFDWMGAGKPGKSYGVRDFKLQFGGELINHGRFTKIHWPLGYTISIFGFKLWKKLTF
jgi:serine/alanine adding enzyme